MEPPILDPLPIETSRARIEQAVSSHQVVILQAETGAGKSTRVPQYLLSCAPFVVITQPRCVAAAAVAKRVAEEMSVELGTVVGYRTATKNKASKDTRLLFCTDGLEVMRQVFEGEQHEGAIVVIDEAHEWNLNLELLVAWFRLKISRGFDIRLVIMSATIEAELLATFFDVDVEVISSKGRTFPITNIRPKGGVLGSTKVLLEQEHNTLVFLPGKAEIRRMIAKLRILDLNAEILPLYAGLSWEEQDACFRQYDRPKCIVSTNVAQTSVTVPDIDAVVDGGVERRPEVVEGVEGLYLRPISLADREQRRGRAGRVKPGVYVDCCPVPMGGRKMFPRPAILSQGLEGLVLQLAFIGLDPEDIRFFHKPPQERVEVARRVLQKLQCLDEHHAVTRIGKLVASFPLGVRYARMVVETYQYPKRGKRGRIDRDTLLLAVILEQGGVRNRKSDAWRQYAFPLSEVSSSDAYQELQAFEVARSLPIAKLEAIGIDGIAYERIRDEIQRITSSLASRRLEVRSIRNCSLHRAIVAGLVDQLYKRSLIGADYTLVEGRSTPRKLPPDSVIQDAEYVVGIPWNFEIRTEFGGQTKRLLRAATEVAPAFIEKLSRG
jgi:HrpA-like RNA helicase